MTRTRLPALPRHRLRATSTAVAAFAALVLAAPGSPAQSTAQPQPVQLQPGLWELAGNVRSQSGQVERAMAEAQAQIAKLPPEQRRQIEQMMADRGVGIAQGGGTTVKVCLAAEDVAQGNVPVQSGECSQQVTARSGDTVKVAFTCRTEPPASGTGELTLVSPIALRSTAVVSTTVNGQPDRIDTTQTGRWLGADCGAIPRPAR